jgi:hypothetical protein
MNFPTPTGSGRAIVNGCPQNISWKPSSPAYDDGTEVTLANGGAINLNDYEERLDYHVSASDDGRTFYHTMVLLEPGEADPAILPTTAELRETATAALAPLMEAVMDDRLHPDDLNFARLLFTNPDCINRVANKHGSVEQGRKAIIRLLMTNEAPL